MSDLADQSDSDHPLLGLLARYGREDGHYLALGVGADAVKSFVGFADVFVVGLAIDALFNDQPLALPLVPDAWIPSDPLAMVVFVGAVLFAVNASTVVGGSLAEYSFGVFAQRFLHRVRVAAFDAAQHRSLAAVDGHRTGDVLSALNDDVNQLETFVTVLVGAAVWIVVTLAAAVVYMAVLNWQLAVFVLASAPVVAALNYWFAQRLEPRQQAVRGERGDLNAHVETSLDGVGVLKAATAEDFERDRVAAASLDHFRARFRAKRLAVRQTPLNRLVAGAWLLGTLAVGVHWILVGPPPVFSGTLTAGELVPFLFYMERVTLPLRNLSGVIDGFERADAAAQRIDGLTSGTRRDGDTTSESGRSVESVESVESDHTAESVPSVESGDRDDFTVRAGRVAFDDVTFTYPGEDTPAVSGVDFTAAGGETVGLVGSTGAGKSTLVKLLLRLYDPDSGTVCVDGTDLRDVPAKRLREHVGYVSQDAFLFNDTVRHNIAYGAGGDVSDERVRAAASEAGVHEEILDLPEGYDTEVGDRGVKLSGGQRQRIAIARAVVGDPEILVLDEATSHVDSETERVLQRRLADLTEDRTTFVVAHRLSTVRAADRILVLDGGELTEQGTHDALLDRGGAYATLWNVQVGDVDAAETAGD
ncbi:MAG: ABC transporter ATP-binding protein [Halobacterium sp.]